MRRPPGACVKTAPGRAPCADGCEEGARGIRRSTGCPHHIPGGTAVGAPPRDGGTMRRGTRAPRGGSWNLPRVPACCTRRHASRCRARRRQHGTWRRPGHEGGAHPVSRRLDHTHALRQHHNGGGALPPIEGMMGRHRSGRQREPCCMPTLRGCWPRPITRRRSSRRFSWRSAGAARASRPVWRAARPRSTASFGSRQPCYRPSQTRGRNRRSIGSVRRIMVSSRMPRSSPCSSAVAGVARRHAERGRLADLRPQRKHRRHGAA